MKGLFLPSLVNLVVPLAVTGYFLANPPVMAPPRRGHEDGADTSAFERQLMFFLWLGILMAVPVFNTVTHLPPFYGIIFGVCILWAIGDLVHRKQEDLKKQRLTLARALTRIDMAVIVMLMSLVSAVVDNVPLVAASMGMYTLAQYPTDNFYGCSWLTVPAPGA